MLPQLWLRLVPDAAPQSVQYNEHIKSDGHKGTKNSIIKLTSPCVEIVVDPTLRIFSSDLIVSISASLDCTTMSLKETSSSSSRTLSSKFDIY